MVPIRLGGSSGSFYFNSSTNSDKAGSMLALAIGAGESFSPKPLPFEVPAALWSLFTFYRSSPLLSALPMNVWTNSRSSASCYSFIACRRAFSSSICYFSLKILYSSFRALFSSSAYRFCRFSSSFRFRISSSSSILHKRISSSSFKDLSLVSSSY